MRVSNWLASYNKLANCPPLAQVTGVAGIKSCHLCPHFSDLWYSKIYVINFCWSVSWLDAI